MGHQIDRCDFLDVLEEAAVLHRPVLVELREGTVFEDRVRDVVTELGEDFAIFVDHARVPVSDIAHCRRASPPA
jgi:transcriptional antiterminator Rof (Rho-off)